MKAKGLIVITVIQFFTVGLSFGQNPGYMGKKNVVSIGASAMPITGVFFAEVTTRGGGRQN